MPYSYDLREKVLEVFYNLAPEQERAGWMRAVDLPYTYSPEEKRLEVDFHLWLDENHEAIVAGWHPAQILPEYSNYK
jgi:hypothetical protein